MNTDEHRRGPGRCQRHGAAPRREAPGGGGLIGVPLYASVVGVEGAV